MGIQQASCYPRAVIHIDLAVNLPTTARGNKHILCIVDSFTRFIVAAPLKNRSGQAILEAFQQNWIGACGLPAFLKSDNELGAKAGVFAEFCEAYGIEIHNSLAYSPQGNGAAEAVVKTIKGALRSFCLAENAAKDWDKYLWLLCNSANSLVSSATGHSPDTLMFGFTSLNLLQNPINLLKNPERFSKIAPEEITRAHVHAMIQSVSNMRDKQRAKNLQFRNSHKTPPPFAVGDVVLHKRLSKAVAQGVPAALSPKYSGPYVINQLFEHMAEIKHCLWGNVKITSTNHLKPYFENDLDYQLPPSWDDEILKFQQHSEKQIDKKLSRREQLPPKPPEEEFPDDPG